MLDVGSLLISVARSVPLCLGHPVGSIPGWRSAELDREDSILANRLVANVLPHQSL
jgi:hypothetical protein